MYASINILVSLFFSIKLFGSDYKPPIIFTKAEFVNATTTRIPFKVVDQLIIVEVAILDKSGNFIIDTGSETLVLNSKHFKAPLRYLDHGKQTNGVHGSIENVKEKYLEALRIHKLSIEQLNADVIDLSHFERLKNIELLGIIGYSVLKDFEVFIDMHLNQITLTKTNKYGEHLSQKVYAETIKDSIAFDLRAHTIILDAFVGDKKVRFGLDTAAEYNQLNETVDSEILDYFYPSKELKLTGASGKNAKVLAGKLYRVRLNNSIYFGPMKTVLCNLKKMNSAFNTSLDGILGFEFFAQKRTIINYKKRKLYFMESPMIKP